MFGARPLRVYAYRAVAIEPAMVAATVPASSNVRRDQQVQQASGFLANATHTSPRIGESCSWRRSSAGPSRMNSTSVARNLDRHRSTPRRG